MSSEKLKIGDFVWAKMKGYPHWPAKIVEPTSSAKVPKNKSSYFVYFYGSKNYAWIQDKNVIPHSPSVFDTLVNKRSNAYQQAIDEFTSQLKASSGKKEKPETKKKLPSKKKDTDNESVENGSNSKSSKFDADDDSTEPKITPSKSKARKKKVYKKRASVSTPAEEKGATSKIADDNEESDSTDDSIEPYMHSPMIKEKRKVLQKKKRISNGSSEKESSNFHSKFDDDDNDSVSRSDEPLLFSPQQKKTLKSGKKATKVVKVAKSVSKKYKRKVYHSKGSLKKIYKKKPVDIDFNGKTGTSFSSSLYDKPDTYDESSNSSWGSANIDKSSRELQIADDSSDGLESSIKSIGFLGLDCMGEFIVRQFLDAKFDVTLWKEEVSDENKYEGVKMADSPADMVYLCDAIFSYYSDRELLKKNLLSEMGILKGFEEVEKLGQAPKGFVLLTAIDKKTSSEINEVITVKKGLYLEAPICGTIEEAKSGKLIILASGHMKLFNDCKKYLSVITKMCKFLIYKNKNPESTSSSSAENANYSSSTENANYSSKYSIIVNMLNAGITAAVSESAVLTKKLAIPQQDMMNVMEAALKCNFGVLEKLDSINNHTFNKVHTPLKHAQKDLDFCLQIADSVSHPMPVASATNEVYKQAKLLNYSDSDVTSVYKILKY